MSDFTVSGAGIRGYIISLAGVVVVTALLSVIGHLNSATASLCYLLVVLSAATFVGRGPALAASVAAASALNYFFLDPIFTLTVSDPENWVSLIVFLAVAVTVGHLSGTARRRTREAESLYEKLQRAFEKEAEAEAVRRNEKLKSALLDAVTHDLRTPLTSIKAAATMLIREDAGEDIHSTLEPEDRGDLLSVINEETDRLNGFVESMVEMARVEVDAASWSLVPASIEQIVSLAVERCGHIDNGRRFNVKLPDAVVDINADPKAVAEALYNILENAVKYSPAESTITIRAELRDSNVKIAIEDEGPGIPIRERERIFQKFYRVDRASGGFGMGLAIVRAIIEAHGGRVWVEPGVLGSIFNIELPAAAK
jgi:two-component system sensor histidine kinase KdpD